jgi:hypothetical protein
MADKIGPVKAFFLYLRHPGLLNTDVQRDQAELLRLMTRIKVRTDLSIKFLMIGRLSMLKQAIAETLLRSQVVLPKGKVLVDLQLGELGGVGKRPYISGFSLHPSGRAFSLGFRRDWIINK